MPNYEFICESCGDRFQQLLSITDREKPLSESCSKCGDRKIKRNYDQQTVSLASDMLLTPNKKTGGQWNELMTKMKKGLPKYTHANLDNATNRNARRWQS